MKHPAFCAWLLAASVLLADQASKYYFLFVVDIASRPPISVTPFFDLVMVWNHGISFGLFAGHNARWALIAMALAIVAILARWLAKSPPRIARIGIGLVIGGALSNVWDRLYFGAVADFFYFHLGAFSWPAFNIADSAICIGVAILCIESMLPRKPQPVGEPE